MTRQAKMKKTALLIILFISALVSGETSPVIDERFDEIELTNGRILERVKIKDVLPDGVFLYHSTGVETIPQRLFPEEIRKRFPETLDKTPTSKPIDRTITIKSPAVEREYDEFDDFLKFTGTIAPLNIDTEGQETTPLKVVAIAIAYRDLAGNGSDSIGVSLGFFNMSGDLKFANAKVRVISNISRIIPMTSESDMDFHHGKLSEMITANFTTADFAKMATATELSFKIGAYDYQASQEFRDALYRFAQTVFSKETEEWQAGKDQNGEELLVK